MIAQRFRALGWVAGIASAATCLYLTSLQVAAERGKLEATESQIVAAKRDMRQLQTELGTRASLRQLEKWNGEVLALTAPRAEQYLHSEAELASVGVRELKGPTGTAPLAPVMLAAAQTTPEAPAPIILANAPAEPAAARVQRVSFVPPPAKPVSVPRASPAVESKQAPAARHAPAAKPKAVEKPVRDAAVKPKPKPVATPERIAAAKPKTTPKTAGDRPVLTRRALGDLARVAVAESKGAGRRR